MLAERLTNIKKKLIDYAVLVGCKRLKCALIQKNSFIIQYTVLITKSQNYFSNDSLAFCMLLIV